MLVLARRKAESITFMFEDPRDPNVLLGTVTVSINEIDRGRVRVGIEADQSIRVFRSELVPRLVGSSPEAARKDEFQVA